MSHDAQFSPIGLPLIPPQPCNKPSLDEIVQLDGRHPLQAYIFVFEALDYATSLYERSRHSLSEEERHVTGQQLLEAIRRYALEQYGYMAWTLFREFNIHSTADIGRIVFFLVSHGLMGKTENDRVEDFVGQYDLNEVFDRDFEFQADDDTDLSVSTPYFSPSE